MGKSPDIEFYRPLLNELNYAVPDDKADYLSGVIADLAISNGYQYSVGFDGKANILAAPESDFGPFLADSEIPTLDGKAYNSAVVSFLRVPEVPGKVIPIIPIHKMDRKAEELGLGRLSYEWQTFAHVTRYLAWRAEPRTMNTGGHGKYTYKYILRADRMPELMEGIAQEKLDRLTKNDIKLLSALFEDLTRESA